MRSAGGAAANSAVAERSPDRAFRFPEGLRRFEPAGAEEQHPSRQRSYHAVKGRAQIVEFYALKTSDDLPL
jgi:hypothetical protein